MDNNSFSLKRHAKLLTSSFKRLTGKDLIDPNIAEENLVEELDSAPFCVVSHNTDPDPIFNYGNQAALTAFEMDWDSFTRLPSRQSAEAQIQEERDRLLKQVTEKGFIDDYTGVRISATGNRFFVKDAIVWNLIDDEGKYCGQAAVLYEWEQIKPQD